MQAQLFPARGGSAFGGKVNSFLTIKGDFLFLAREFYCFGKEGRN
jgi:hypothetical protein